MTCSQFYQSLPPPWDRPIPEFGPVKELHKVAREAANDKCAGNRLYYAAWRRKFIAMVHSQRMLVADKSLALALALDAKQEVLASILGQLNYDAKTYAAIIR
jgi:hypothetical protein